MIPDKPEKVLCKRTLSSGKPYWWDETVVPPVRHEHDNRMLVEGDWYDIIEHSWDEEKREFWFKIIDNQNNPHSFTVYAEEDKDGWPSFCINYGPRDYAKWFYTPQELLDLIKFGTPKTIEDLNVRVGCYYWVKSTVNPFEWVIANCVSRESRDVFIWNIWGQNCKSDMISEIGNEIQSNEDISKNMESKKVDEELLDEIFPLIDAINKKDPDKHYPSVEYIMPFVNKAVSTYIDKKLSVLSHFFG